MHEWSFIDNTNWKCWIKYSLSDEYIQIQILNRQFDNLRTKEVLSVKVRWRNQIGEEATLEAEGDMKNRYPHLYECRDNLDHGTKSVITTF